MIQFPCHCGHQFSLGDDAAGGMIQCPKCGRLNDIPSLSDVQQIDDGIFRLSDPEPRKSDSQHLSEMRLLHTRQRVDDMTGEEIDLRPTEDDIANSGIDEVPLEMTDVARPGRPRYDPITGELVRPMDVKPPTEPRIDPATVPFAKKTLEYATRPTEKIGAGDIFLALFRPVNLFVMSFVVLLHIFLQVTILVWAGGVFFIAPVVIVAAGMILAHYGIVIDEIGPTGRDELPRPFRELSWSDDLWGPASRFAFSLVLCFWPLMLPWELFSRPAYAFGLGAILLLGLFMFPAVLLTATTSGSLVNLRIDRVVRVIGTCGGHYLVVLAAFTIAGGIYLTAITALTLSTAALFISKTLAAPLIGVSVSSIGIIVGVFLMHFACWHLGRLYRLHYDRFPWTLQHHVRTKKREPLRRQRRYPQNRTPAESQSRLTEIRENEKKHREESEKYLDKILPPDNGRHSHRGGLF